MRVGSLQVINGDEWMVAELEWTPKGRLIVRMLLSAGPGGKRGDELALTPRELKLNGATIG